VGTALGAGQHPVKGIAADATIRRDGQEELTRTIGAKVFISGIFHAPTATHATTRKKHLEKHPPEWLGDLVEHSKTVEAALAHASSFSAEGLFIKLSLLEFRPAKRDGLEAKVGPSRSAGRNSNRHHSRSGAK